MDLSLLFLQAREASRSLAMLSEQKIDSIIIYVAEQIRLRSHEILAANAQDIARVEQSAPSYDRLLLTPERVEGIANDMESVAQLNSPVGEILSSTTRPNGMTIDKVRVPFGVIGVIYEARPNVSLDVFTLCLKSSNASVLKGGSDAEATNIAIVKIIKDSLIACGVDPQIVTLLPCSREATSQMLCAVEYIDLIIPRGGRSLIDFVRENSKVPVIETGAGVCHTYVDKDAYTERAKAIIDNAKTRRVSVCNALDTVVIHKDRIKDLPTICEPLAAKGVTIYADCCSYAALEGSYPTTLLQRAEPSHFGVEFLDYKLSIRSVGSLEEAVEYITQHTSKHSEAIVTECKETGELFCRAIDAACLYINVSTAFSDGAQFGFGAEIGISTQKMHARGPMALPELTTYKYIIRGDGQVR